MEIYQQVSNCEDNYRRPPEGVRGSPCDKEWECMNYSTRKRQINFINNKTKGNRAYKNLNDEWC